MNQVESKVVSAVVFTDRARVTRHAKAKLAVGENRVVLAGLPSDLDPASVRVTARASAPTKLVGVDCKRTFSTAPSGERIRDLEEKIQTLQDEVDADNIQGTTYSKLSSHLDGLADSNRAFAYALAQGKTTLEQQASFLDFLEQQRLSIEEKIRVVKVRKRERKKQILKLQQEVGAISSFQPHSSYQVSVEIHADAVTEVELNVTYVLDGATWRPLYDVRLRGEEVDITYLAEVQQSTGEDWTGVALTLSTARPATSATLSRLQPWRLAVQQPIQFRMPPAAARAAGAMTWSTAAAPDVDMMAQPEAAVEAEVSFAKVEQNEGIVTFQIAGPVDIPSDNTPRKSAVGLLRLRPELDYVTIPKQAAAFYRRAKIRNATDFTLLPGRAQLFVDDDFLGSCNLSLTAPGQVFEMFFGTDDRLRVDRGLTKQGVSKTFMGGRRRLQFAYEIRLWNHRKEPQKVTVVDQIPLAQHEDIKVTLDNVEPKKDRQDDLNVIVWKLTLEPGAERKIAFAFTIEHPKEMNISGLG